MDAISSLPQKTKTYINEGVKIVLVFFIAAAVIIFSIHSLVSIAYPYSLDYGEAPLIDQAKRLSEGENIYRASLDTPPYTIANYPPFYIATLVPFLNWFESPFLMGRFISVLASVLSAIFIGLCVHLFTDSRLSALASAALFLASPYVVQWSGRARIDSLALAFATGALFVLARWPKSRWAWLGTGLLLVCAAYTRQSYALAAPLAAFVWLWTQNRRRALELAILVAGLGALLFVTINTLSNGGFYYNIITANVNEFGWMRLKDQLTRLWNDNWITLLIGASFLAIGWRSRKSWPLAAPFLLGAFISALTIGKVGSNVNYFLEMSAALALIGGVVLAWDYRSAWQHSGIVLLIAIQLGILMRSSMQDNVDWILTQRQVDVVNLQYLEQEVINMDGIVLADENMGMLTANHRRLYLQPFEVSQLANEGMWDQSPLLEQIAAQEFSGILIHHFGTWEVYKERWTPEMLAAIKSYYQPVRTLAGTVIFIPKVSSELSAVPTPIENPVNTPDPAQVGRPIAVGAADFLAEADIAINPANPDHLVAIATRASKQSCELPTCKIELVFYDSRDAGETWQERVALNRPQQSMYQGLVSFDDKGFLDIMGIRDDIIVLNRINQDQDYLPAPTGFKEITRAQVNARPWMQVQPQTGEIYLSFDAQEGDMLYVTPGLIHSSDGVNWSVTSRANQHVSATDISSPRATGPMDIRVLFGEGDNLSLVWVWDPMPWIWPRTVWMAYSSDGGDTFAEPTPILETWGPINTASANGKYAIVYRTGEMRSQQLAVATSTDNGLSWDSTIASGEVPLYFEADKGPGIGVAPDGTVDLVFYTHNSDSLDCVLDVRSWQQTVANGRVDPCAYDVFYTYSLDDELTFAQPAQLNQEPVRGEDFLRFNGASWAGSHLGIASGEGFAYPIWIGTPQDGKTQVYSARIAR